MNRHFETIIKLVLSPYLAAQALKVRKMAKILPDPPGHRSGETGTGPNLTLMIVGDSSASGVGAPHQSLALSGQMVHVLGGSYHVKWRVMARSGATSCTVRPILKSQDPQKTDVALVVLGVNDVTSQMPLNRVLSCRAELYTMLFESWQAKRVIATGVPPIDKFPLLPNPLRWVLGLQARRFDKALAEQAGSMGVEYMPFDVPLTPEMMAEDGFHPGPNAYALLGHTVATQIMHR
ncbi:lipase [Aliiroseovarius zhejiangensis]|uniref:Lipase n=1 Tax=Aliiroseovarius zhejiangensis TaxID=1632025 RepID=A0ABQ3J4N8_9RHOB|nr:SGNH/GDSL hydrolase family protein [Aliiroseovarius zhejiangensis]GHF00298.1 lipase [Aliiroseovarius zhejiangensis]